jgi:hypothetical protein
MKDLNKEQLRLVRGHPLVWAWGHYMNWKRSYIFETLRVADILNAPMDALFQDFVNKGEWRTVSQIQNTGAIDFLKKFIDEEFGWELVV